VGEKVDDLEVFEANRFVAALTDADADANINTDTIAGETDR